MTRYIAAVWLAVAFLAPGCIEDDAKATTSGADCTVFTTTLTVSVKSLNLANGTVVTVTDAFTPVGTITLSGGQGSMSTDLGHFFPAGDTIRVQGNGTTYLAGKMAIH